MAVPHCCCYYHQLPIKKSEAPTHHSESSPPQTPQNRINPASSPLLLHKERRITVHSPQEREESEASLSFFLGFLITPLHFHYWVFLLWSVDLRCFVCQIAFGHCLFALERYKHEFHFPCCAHLISA
ncbi:hypothetical protein NE237_022587 [Protea cynaroides]|uniref:Uncharacterized protein n=1 Tax=Protea cynaroides TaxID=273540 RepID=A0A9Q0HDA9_9MAGN|nr:hypothetical protein NE237_022587 [Protea cynaroides]